MHCVRVCIWNYINFESSLEFRLRSPLLFNQVGKCFKDFCVDWYTHFLQYFEIFIISFLWKYIYIFVYLSIISIIELVFTTCGLRFSWYIELSPLLGPFTYGFWGLFFYEIPKRGEIPFYFHADVNRVIIAKFCTWYDFCTAVVACGKICNDQVSKNWIIANIFLWNLNCRQNSIFLMKFEM